MTVYVLFDYNDFVGVYATREAAQAAISAERNPSAFSVSEQEVQG